MDLSLGVRIPILKTKSSGSGSSPTRLHTGRSRMQVTNESFERSRSRRFADEVVVIREYVQACNCQLYFLESSRRVVERKSRRARELKEELFWYNRSNHVISGLLD